MHVQDIPGIESLSIPEKMALLDELWENISSDEASLPVPESHVRELERRLARHIEDPTKLLSLEELQRRIDSRR